jgi:hypothetical protein
VTFRIKSHARSAQAARLDAAVRDAMARAREDSRDGGDGVATFKWGAATITVRDTDMIGDVVKQVKKDLGIE